MIVIRGSISGDAGEAHLVHRPRDLPDWAQRIGRLSLVIIDEVGMADTSPGQRRSVHHGRGGSVRLVGDDQELGAIGANSVLRDIETNRGAVR
jgi:ATP-dependent exoDNAse (exonuclease V) alpha subunit